MAIACACVRDPSQLGRRSQDVPDRIAKRNRTKFVNSKNVIETNKNQLTMEKASRRESIAVLEQRASQYRERLVSKEQQFTDLQAQHQQAIETIANYQKNMTRLKEEVATLRTDTRETHAERDVAITRVANLTDKVHQGEGMIELLRQQNKQLAVDNGLATLVLDSNDLTKDDPVDHIPPKVDGQITAVGRNGIEISIGSDEGLRKGHRLHVFSLNRGYLGDVIIGDTRPDRAVGQMIPETVRGNIREGDRVATKIL